MSEIELTPVGPNDWVRGPQNAPVTLVEYADFECPYCRDADAVVRSVEHRFAGKLRLVFRHFPLREMHPHAEAAAEAAQAAGAQGRFWEMHDALFAGTQGLEHAALSAYARAAGVPDLERFEHELGDGRYRPDLDSAIERAEESGVEGTPMFFINGMPFEDEPTVEDLGSAIEEALSTTTR